MSPGISRTRAAGKDASGDLRARPAPGAQRPGHPRWGRLGYRRPLLPAVPRQGGWVGRGAGSAERMPLRLHLKGRGKDSPPRPPQALPGSAAGWAAGWQEGALEVGHVSLGGRLHRRKPELCLCGYNKPVAWWGNLHASQVTAASPGQQCPQPGAPRPLRGAGCAEPPRVGRAGPGGRTTGSLGQGGPGRGPEAAAPGQPRGQHQGTCPSCAWGRHRLFHFCTGSVCLSGTQRRA